MEKVFDMRTASLTEAETHLNDLIEQTKVDGPIVITRDGEAVAVLLSPMNNGDLENILITRSRRFQRMLERTRAIIREGKSVENVSGASASEVHCA